MFDRVDLRVKAGGGGDGAISFRREKYVPFGGPDGGDGGDGGNVVIAADTGVADLGMFRQNKLYQAGKGENGKGQKKHGKRGEDLVLMVPEGTLVLDKEQTTDNALVADCEQPGQHVVVARGGKGGLGNVHFVSSTNQAPRIAQKGEVGEELSLALELRLIADVGIIGFPNAGKSTLLAGASAARPKIAGYPFTTLEPILGVVEADADSFVIAEIPGLIEGAHMGRGLGHDFLRHIMRTKILIHIVDGSSESPAEDMTRVNTELSLYDPVLAQKQQIVAVNKIDLPQVQSRKTDISRSFRDIGTPVRFISAVNGEGVAQLLSEAIKVLNRVSVSIEKERGANRTVFRPQPKGARVNVHKEDDVFVIAAPDIERIVTRVETDDPEVRRQLQRLLTRKGVTRILEKAGVRPGDKLRCGDYEWEW